jgi:hypothetical protein
MLIAPVLHGDVYMLARRTTGILWEMMAVYQILGFLANPGIRETMAWWYAISCRQIDFVSDFFYAEELQLLNAEPWNWQQQIAQRDEMVSIGHFAFLYVMGRGGREFDGSNWLPTTKHGLKLQAEPNIPSHSLHSSKTLTKHELMWTLSLTLIHDRLGVVADTVD